jgi:hypothetical protein
LKASGMENILGKGVKEEVTYRNLIEEERILIKNSIKYNLTNSGFVIDNS